MTDRPIKIIFDTSAIVAFARGSIDVGKVLAEVNDEEAAAGLPVLCVVEAHRVVQDHDQFMLLLRHPATRIISPDPDDWHLLAAALDQVGRMDAASAVVDAGSCHCWILTCQSALYGGLPRGGPIIPF